MGTVPYRRRNERWLSDDQESQSGVTSPPFIWMLSSTHWHDTYQCIWRSCLRRVHSRFVILPPMESFPSGVEGSAGSSLPRRARLDVNTLGSAYIGSDHSIFLLIHWNERACLVSWSWSCMFCSQNALSIDQRTCSRRSSESVVFLPIDASFHVTTCSVCLYSA